MMIGITAGDPAGIGLEVVLKAVPTVLSEAQWVLFVDSTDFEANLERFAPSLPWSTIDALDRAESGQLSVSPIGRSTPLEWGRGTAESGRRALRALDTASTKALAGEIDAIVTAPLSKQLVGKEFRGQTDFLRDRAAVRQAAMSFFTPTFKVVLATTHLSVRDAVSSLSMSLYVDLIHFIDTEFQKLGFPRPKIAVAAVNPHAGEGGMFGSEDDEILSPAVVECRKEGIPVSGPHPADSLYPRAHSGEFDVVLAPYHDQGLIPVKLIAHRTSANVTLGLPYVRTSPDHGTAFPIAGRGEAECEGMETALRWALELCRRSKRADVDHRD